MSMKIFRFIPAAVVLAALPVGPEPLLAQGSPDTVTVYHREVFSYARAGRPDPFRSLLNSADLGVRFEDLALQGIMYHPDRARSVVVLSQRGSSRRIRARVGDRIGTIRILAIGPRAVEVVIEEFGVARRETMELTSVRVKGGTE